MVREDVYCKEKSCMDKNQQFLCNCYESSNTRKVRDEPIDKNFKRVKKRGEENCGGMRSIVLVDIFRLNYKFSL